jgi:SAM-dependent methyltransferase
VGVALAPLFDHVTFVEPDEDMLVQARAHASAAGMSKVDFIAATAENLNRLGLAAARVVSFGQSFHRTDRLRAAAAVDDVLEPGGSMVLIVHDPGRPAPRQPANTSVIPHEEIRDLVRTFLGSELRSDVRLSSSYEAERFEETLARTRFGPPRMVVARGRPDIVGDIDTVIANYLSMSFAAPHLFGPRLPQFVGELRTLLERRSPNGRFWDWPGDTAVIIATRR